MSIAELVADIEKERDAWKEAADFSNKKVGVLAADRDQWKARAEKLEAKASELECELHAARSIPRQTIADLQLKAELQQALEAAEKRVKELTERCNHRGRAVDELNARIADLERQLAERPFSTLEAVLEECRIAGIETHISVVDRQEFRVCVQRSGGVSRSTYAPDAAAAASAIESIVCSQDFYPDSAFARRRKPAEPEAAAEPTPNSSKTSNSSDYVADLPADR